MEHDDVVAKFVRLTNGDDLICEMVELSEDDQILFMVINPLKVVYIPTAKAGYMQIALIPWVFPRMVDHQEFTISPEDVLTISDASVKMNEYYWENLDQFVQPEEVQKEDIEEETNIEDESLQNILEAIRSSRRTYH